MRAEALGFIKPKKTRSLRSATKVKQPVALYRADPMTAYRNQFLCGDSLEVMRQMPSASIDLVVTSPPYNLKNSTGNGMKNDRGGKCEKARGLE